MGKKNKDIAEKDIRAEETAAEEKDIQPEAEEKETCTSSNFEGECEVGENPVPEPDYQAENAVLQDKLLRLQADYQNYRKRMARELADARKVGVIDTLTSFLTVFDQLDMARVAAAQSDNVEALRQGLEMINNTFAKELENLGVARFSAVGEKFDPELHDAVAQQPSEDFEEGVVSGQWCCGYKLGDRLLRPARVVVSAGSGKKDAEDGAAE